mgnify:FL=1
MSTPLPNATELALPDDGADTDVWGLLNNALWSAWDRSFGGRATADISSADWTPSTTAAQCGRLIVTGSTALERNLILPANDRLYIVVNASGGNYGITIKTATVDAETIFLPSGGVQLVWPDDTTGNIYGLTPPRTVDNALLDSIRRPGKDFDGASLYFGDGQTGFGKVESGVLGFFLKDDSTTLYPDGDGGFEASAQHPEVRFDARNTAEHCLINFTNGRDGFIVERAGLLAAVAAGAKELRWGNGGGVAVGDANGPAGAGSINTSAYYRSGVRSPYMWPSSFVGLSVSPNAYNAFAHGRGIKPNMLVGQLRCIAADVGYAGGDFVNIDGGSYQIVIGANVNQVFYRVNNAYQLPTKTGSGGSLSIDPAKWRLDIFATWA